MGAKEITVVTGMDNKGSYRIAEKLGFKKAQKPLPSEDGVEKNLYILPDMIEPEESVFRMWGDA